MTRLIATVIAIFIEVWACFGIASIAKAQTYTNPSASSRYAPQQGAGLNTTPVAGPASAGAAAAAQQRTYGPQASTVQQAGGPQATSPRATAPSALGNTAGPIRTVADEQPIRQPPPGAAPAAVQAPDWVPLPADHQKYVDDILKFWEGRSDEISTYKCAFQRWDYDPIFGPKEEAKTFSEGAIQYAKPDKGLLKVEKYSQYTPPAKEGDKPQYVPQTDYGEHWVCDGKRIFEFDTRNKKVIERPLPPDMQGKAIADGPLPFLFGAKAATINARYWIRAITPPDVKGEYWLEAIPKSRQDSANFKMVHIILAEKDFLPKALQVFAPNFDPKTNPSRQIYKFEDRVVNSQQFDVLNKLNPFAREFFEPKTPSGWKKIVERIDAGAPQSAEQRSEQRPDQTARPPMPSVPR
jgi:TIGR03009 family protein